MTDNDAWPNQAQVQLDEVRGLLNAIKAQVREKQVKGLEVSPELLLLMGNLIQQEAKIWWGIGTINNSDETSGPPLKKDFQKKVEDFRESYARAINLLAGVNLLVS